MIIVAQLEVAQPEVVRDEWPAKLAECIGFSFDRLPHCQGLGVLTAPEQHAASVYLRSHPGRTIAESLERPGGARSGFLRLRHPVGDAVDLGAHEVEARQLVVGD